MENKTEKSSNNSNSNSNSNNPRNRRNSGNSKGKRGQKKERKPSALEEAGLIDRLVAVNRCAKVTKGGRSFGFNAIVAVGDQSGSVGIGLGKATELPESIRKATENARKTMIKVPLIDNRTLPHLIIGHYGAGKVLLRPASPGTGVIAGSAVRAIMECAGVKDVLTKAQGSNNPHNVTKATMCGLKDLIKIDHVSSVRRKIVTERSKANG